MAREFLHLLRLGTHAEQDYVLRGRSFFDAIVLNANLVEGSKSAIAVLVTRLQKPYFIDPVTYAFALDPRLLRSAGPGNPRPKRSFSALAAAYGLDPGFVGVRPVTSDWFADDGAVEDFAAHVIDYQRTAIGNALADDAAFLTSELSDRAKWVGPHATLAPYFVEDFRDGWRNVNVRSLSTHASATRDLRGGAIGVDSRQLTPQNIAELAGTYAETDLDQAFMWLTNFDEHAATVGQLAGYARLTQFLASQGKAMMASYGGFYSLLLAFRGLAGSSHGIGYGDKRDLEPLVGGGLPPARYYLRPVRDFVSLADLGLVAAGISEDEFRSRICQCTICEGLLREGGVDGLIEQFTETEDRLTATGRVVAVATPRAYRLTRFHYMSVRAEEFDLIRNTETLNLVLGTLVAESRWVEGRLGLRATAHIGRWHDAMEMTEPV
jgi:hypothetical protein